MIPGLNKLKGAIDHCCRERHQEDRGDHQLNDGKRKGVYPNIIDGSSRRIAKGSGTQVHDVNELLKKYMETKKMIKKMTKGGMKGLQRQLLFR